MKNMKIGARLSLLVIMFVLMLCGVGIFGLQASGKSAAAMEASYNAKLVPTAMVGKVMMLMNENRSQIMLGLQHDPSNPLSKMHDHSLSTHADVLTKNRDEITAIIKEYSNREMTAEEKALTEKYAASRAKYVSEGLMPAMEALLAGNFPKANEILLKNLNPAYANANADANALLQYLQKTAKSDLQAATDSYSLMRAISIASIILGSLLGIIIATWIIRSVVRPLNEAISIARTVAAGDLNVHIEANVGGEFGQLLNALRDMSNSLQNVIWHVRQGLDTFTSASREIASGNMDLSSRTEQQASSLEETASSMEELTSTVRQNADNARQANQLAMTASDVAVKGGAVVTQVVDTMHAIHDSSKRIADIISVIDGIAFQTNILALNAAVEAARAGEQGRGFAVVATEVRSLAQRSASAAREIKSLIDDSVGKIEVGNKLVDQAGVTMEEVVTSVKRVNDIMAEITEASREQSEGIEQVNQAITQMDTVTQQNAALVEQSAAAAESLQGQAAVLAETVSVFKVKTAQHGTTDEAYEIVMKILESMRKNGKEKTYAEINNKLGRYSDRDLYAVVYDLHGRNVAHGAFPAMVGKDLIDAKDGAGKLYVRERLEIIQNHGKGWQDYTFTNPVTKQMEPKSMYLEKFDDVIVGCGAYKK